MQFLDINQLCLNLPLFVVKRTNYWWQILYIPLLNLGIAGMPKFSKIGGGGIRTHGGLLNPQHVSTVPH